MKNRQITRYVCQKCGAQFPKWQGQCSQCGAWNSLVETAILKPLKSSKSKSRLGPAIKLLKLSEIKSKSFKRIKTDITELDRVLGGGIVPGSLVLVAGEPGIGKSTLLTQLALKLAISKTPKLKNSKQDKNQKLSVLYVCGEESPSQIKIRIKRLLNSNYQSASSLLEKPDISRLLFLAETNIENILSTINHQSISASAEKQAIGLIIVDSIQTIWTENLTGASGSVGQVRQCSNILLNLAKKTNIPVFLIGHITKQGAIAGPKVLEHLVDTVLYLEGDQKRDFRILRTTKNRFGSTDEVGIFQMRDAGMREVKNPGELFLGIETNQKTTKKDNRQKTSLPGAAITCSMQGLRPMLVEIQALVTPSSLPIPRRVASGINYQKLQILAAVIQKRLNLPLYQSDIFVSVAGGLKLSEPAIDLAVCLAIISSFKNKPLPSKSVCLGEVDLLGQIRPVAFMDKRIKEAKKLGYKTVIGEKERGLNQTLKYLNPLRHSESPL